MKKFIELEKGTFVKNGKEYDYIMEIAEDFPKKKVGNVRLKIIEERPAINKIRTRYDPEITMYGDKNASMELMLGYDMNEIRKASKRLLFTLFAPFYFGAIFLLMMNTDKIPQSFLPHGLLYILLPVVVMGSILLLVFYYKMNMTMLAEYLKARDLKRLLKKEGFKQDLHKTSN